MKFLITLAIILSVAVLVHGLCQQPTLEQSRKHTWEEENGVKKSLWSVKINNPEGADNLTHVFVDLPRRGGKLDQLWGLILEDEGRYMFPAHTSVGGGCYYEFGYITRSYTSLPFEIFDYACPARDDCVCTALYAPVCGEDGNTYGNQCLARCAGVLKDRDGEC